MTKPARDITDYTPQDLTAFRERFRPLAQRYRERNRKVLYGIAVFSIIESASTNLNQAAYLTGSC